MTKQWPPIVQAAKKTKIGPELHKCPLCFKIVYTGKRSIDVIKQDYPEAVAGRMDKDHIIPVIDPADSGKEKDWNKIIMRMFCKEDNVQNICQWCHKDKTNMEKSQRAKVRKENVK